jgi:hypothetical protein
MQVVPVSITIGDSGGSQTVLSQTVNMYVEPAMAFLATGNFTAPFTSVTGTSISGSAGTYEVLATDLATQLGTAPATIDTVTATGGNNATQTFAVTACTGGDSNGACSTSADYTLTSTAHATVVKVNRAYAAGYYSVTISAADTGGSPALPTEYITLNFQVN